MRWGQAVTAIRGQGKLPLPHRLERGARQTAMLAFHLPKARQHGAHAERRGIAAVNARQQGVGDILDHRFPVMPPHKTGDRFIAVVGRGTR